MLSRQVLTISWMIICWSLMKRARTQAFYYDDDRAYYHDGGSTNEMYNLDTVEHDQDGSMRALAGIVTEKDATTISYYDEFQNFVTDQNSLNPSQRNQEGTTTTANADHIATDIDVTTTVKIKTKNQHSEDSLKSELETTKQSKINSAFSQSKDTKPAVRNAASNSTYLNPTKLSNQRQKLGNKESTTLTSENINDFSKHKSTSQPDIGEILFPNAFKRNGNTPGNISLTFDYDMKQRNDSMFDFLSNNSGMCDVATHTGCDVIHYERCDSDTRQCRCLNGFFPENAALGTGHCKAASFYHGHLKVTASKSYQGFSNEQMLSLRQKLIVLIGLSLKKAGIDAVLDVDIRSVEIKDHHTSLTFEVGLNKDILSRDEDDRLLLSRDVIVTSQGELVLEAAEHYARGDNASKGVFSPLVEVNPCISSEHNHCSQRASCSYQDGAVSCQCDQGYEDLNPNLYRLPGEVCIEKCVCQNGGICVAVGGHLDSRQCSCLKWYFGSECQIDGKELMLICCCSIGSVVLLALAMCCGYYGCIKHRDNITRSSMFPFSPDINILKLPRVWMDTSGYNDHDLSPNNQRRISVTSERNPYFDGYIMEDVSLGTLQRDKDSHSSYYQVSQTSLGHCPATMSSHSFYRY